MDDYERVTRSIRWLRRHLALRVCELGMVSDPRIGALQLRPQPLDAVAADAGRFHAVKSEPMTGAQIDDVLNLYVLRHCGRIVDEGTDDDQ